MHGHPIGPSPLYATAKTNYKIELMSSKIVKIVIHIKTNQILKIKSLKEELLFFIELTTFIEKKMKEYTGEQKTKPTKNKGPPLQEVGPTIQNKV